MKQICVLYFEGCPNHKPAVDLARSAADELHMNADIREIEVRGPDDAQTRRFLGSPSIQVDGVDIEPAARDRRDFGFSCRTYNGQGLPPKSWIVAALRGESPSDPSGSPEDMHGDDAAPCCETSSASAPVRGDRADRTGLLAAGGAFAAAVVASACCWLPLTLIAFGASAGGLGVLFEQTRPFFLGIAAILLGFGFYRAYSRRACEPGTACATARPRLKRLNRALLWFASAGVLLFALFPAYVEVFLPDTADAARETAAPTPHSSAGGAGPAYKIETASLEIAGMSCEACSITVKSALEKVPGVTATEVRFDEKRAVVRFHADNAPSVQSLVDAIDAVGYKARPMDLAVEP